MKPTSVSNVPSRASNSDAELFAKDLLPQVVDLLDGANSKATPIGMEVQARSGSRRRPFHVKPVPHLARV